jgi:hypothetical protein
MGLSITVWKQDPPRYAVIAWNCERPDFFTTKYSSLKMDMIAAISDGRCGCGSVAVMRDAVKKGYERLVGTNRQFLIDPMTNDNDNQPNF